MVLNLSTFAVFMKTRNIISKIRRSKVTDYAALRQVLLYKHDKSANPDHKGDRLVCLNHRKLSVCSQVKLSCQNGKKHIETLCSNEWT